MKFVFLVSLNEKKGVIKVPNNSKSTPRETLYVCECVHLMNIKVTW